MTDETQALKLVQKKINDLTIRSVFPEEPIHAVNTLEWVLRLMPEADEALQIAALGHDIERSFEDKRIHSEDYDNYEEYKQAHALNSAEILSDIMEECGVSEAVVDDVARLVAHHETGGDEREEILKDADTLSFFHVGLPFYYDRKGANYARRRAVWSFKRLNEEHRPKIAEFDYMDPELRSVVHECLGFED